MNLVYENFGPGQSNLDLIAHKLQKLMHSSEPLEKDKINNAVKLLEKIISSSHPAIEVSKHLGEVDNLFTSLILLNINQADTNGRPDLADGLHSLLENINLQIHFQNNNNRDLGSQYLPLSPEELSILYLADKNSTGYSQFISSAASLSSIGCKAEVVGKFPVGTSANYNVICVHNPHINREILDAQYIYSDKGIPILLYMDVDYERIPINHKDFYKFGLGTLRRTRAFYKGMQLSDHICVSNKYLASRYRNYKPNVSVIPEGWSKENKLWSKPSPTRHTINLGWIGMPGEYEDINLIRRIIVRLVNEFSNVRLVIGGNFEVYQMFDSIPENRRLFLPIVSYEDHPYLLSYFDILMSPLRNIPFYHSINDRWLMEAGVRKIPWVSSALPVVMDWKSGGLVANTQEEWHSHVSRLILDQELRVNLACSGRKKSEEREMGKLVDSWYLMIANTYLRKQKGLYQTNAINVL